MLFSRAMSSVKFLNENFWRYITMFVVILEYNQNLTTQQFRLIATGSLPCFHDSPL